MTTTTPPAPERDWRAMTEDDWSAWWIEQLRLAAGRDLDQVSVEVAADATEALVHTPVGTLVASTRLIASLELSYRDRWGVRLLVDPEESSYTLCLVGTFLRMEPTNSLPAALHQLGEVLKWARAVIELSDD